MSETHEIYTEFAADWRFGGTVQHPLTIAPAVAVSCRAAALVPS
jgi:hypothetical protein